MKNLRNLFMVLVGCTLVATSFTSCLDDDEDNITVTPEEAARRLNIMNGTYQGKAYAFYNEDYKVKSDSTETTFSISGRDSLLTVNLPVSFLSYAVRDKSDTKLIEALKNAGPKKVTFKILLNDIYGENSSTTYGYYLYPASYLKFTCAYEDQTYEVEVKFTTSASYFYTLNVVSYGVYDRGGANGYLPIGSVTVNQQTYAIEPIPFLVVGQK
ncbi:MAG: DUF4840 domain-containing protein [Prevotella sp.]|nr:DUF4840 domain-containing protein [Prevotella sp.]